MNAIGDEFFQKATKMYSQIIDKKQEYFTKILEDYGIELLDEDIVVMHDMLPEPFGDYIEWLEYKGKRISAKIKTEVVRGVDNYTVKVTPLEECSKD